MGVADIGDRRAARKHGSQRGSPCQTIVDDRSPHERQVTTDPCSAADPPAHRAGDVIMKCGRLAAMRRTAYRCDVSTRYIEPTSLDPACGSMIAMRRM